MSESRARQYTLDQIEAELRARVSDLCVTLFGRDNLNVRGANIWILDLARKDANWTSFSYNTQKHIWKDYKDASGETAGKGALSLVAKFATRGDYKNEYDASHRIVRPGAVQWALDWLGWSERPPSAADLRRTVEAAERNNEAAIAAAAKSRAKAYVYWAQAMKRADGAQPLDGKDPASLYLRQRGIDVRALAGGIPGCLAFHPRVWAYSPNDKAMRGPWPAMIAAISREGTPHGFAALHRTYLHFQNGAWGKLTWPDCKTGKQVKGEFAGGCIRLTRGESGKPLAGAPEGEWVQISEGIEDGLTAALVKPELRTLCAVSISNIGGILLPPAIAGAFILKQNDDGAVTQEQFDLAMDKLCARGIEPVIVETPPQFKDINDALRGKEKAA